MLIRIVCRGDPMATPRSGRDDVVVIGGRDSSQEIRIHPNLGSTEQALEIAGRESALAAEELRLAEDKIGVVRREIVTDPTHRATHLVSSAH